jgi:hypothetical protein
VQQPLDLPDWNNATPLPGSVETPQRQAKKPTLTSQSSSNNVNRPPVPKTKWNTDSTTSNQPLHPNQSQAPIDLSLSDDSHHGVSNAQPLRLADSVSPTIPKKSLSSGSGEKSFGSPVENADLLYEYFPLSLDDWMPPVDAIYRPHVVHHTIVPPDLKAQQVKNKTKRYFSADD